LEHRYKHIVFVVCCRAAYLHRFYVFDSNYSCSSSFEIVFILLKRLLFCCWLLWGWGGWVTNLESAQILRTRQGTYILAIFQTLKVYFEQCVLEEKVLGIQYVSVEN